MKGLTHQFIFLHFRVRIVLDVTRTTDRTYQRDKQWPTTDTRMKRALERGEGN